MPLNRREFLRLVGVVTAGATLTGCSPTYERLAGETSLSADVLILPDSDFRALSRLTFGPTLAERQQVAEIGLEGWIEEQLAPDSIDDGSADWRVRDFDILHLNANELAELGDELFDGVNPKPVLDAFRQATLLRQVYSRRQLYEVVAAFWTDHFNISVSKGDCWFLKVVDDREVVRKHTLGNFRDLVGASTQSPAMLIYLDNQANHKDLPNENYARELLELHTLGVHGGYSQADVMEFARCLSGWSVKEHFWRGQFKFEEQRHDPDEKQVLGRKIQPGGMQEVEQVLDALVAHPATARRLARKLARRFLGDDPASVMPELVEDAAQAFLKSRGDIQAMLRVILLDGLGGREGGRKSLSRAGRGSAPLHLKFKRPNEFILSGLRQLHAHTDGGKTLHDYLALMGQPLYAWPTPDGPPDYADAWNTNLMPRWQFAMALVLGEIPGSSIALADLIPEESDPEDIIAKLGVLLLGGSPPKALSDQLSGVLRTAKLTETSEATALVTASLLASPAFQWR